MVHTKQKKCSKCGKVKELETGFYKDTGNKNGYQGCCKICLSQCNKQRYKENPEMYKKKSKKWAKKNSERVKETKRQWSKNNQDKCKEYTYLWVKRNPEKRKESLRKYNEKNLTKIRKRGRLFMEKKRKENPEKYRKYNRQWYKENPEKYRKYNRQWYKENIEKVREYCRQNRILLLDPYVRQQIRNQKHIGLKNHQITPEMIEAKREHLLFYRELKTFKREVQNGIT